MNKAKEKTLDYVERQMVKEKEKFKDGLKNNFYQWEELFDELWREWVEMTNKDAFLKLLFNYYLVDENGKGKHDELVEQIENALESLEIIKKYKDMIIDDINDEILMEQTFIDIDKDFLKESKINEMKQKIKELKILKEWLENEKM